MHCYLCYRALAGLVPNVEYCTFLGATVCTPCADRARDEQGPGWQARARAGCYAGGRIDPHLINQIPAKEIALGDVITAFEDVTGGRPSARPIATFGELPPFAPFGQVVYNRFVPKDVMFIFGGMKAGQSAVIYADSHAHLEHRARLAIAARMKEVEVGFDKIAHDMHHRLERLAREIERDIEATDPRYIMHEDLWGTYLVNRPDMVWRYLGGDV